MDPKLLTELFEIVIIPLLGVLTTYAVKFIRAKIDDIKKVQNLEIEQKYFDMLETTISNCVIATTQTYVDTLKKQKAFGEEEQKEAFRRTYNAVLKILSDEAIIYLTTAVGDLELYITQKIETEVNLNKNFE